MRRFVGALMALPLLCFLPGCSREDLPKPVADWFLPTPEPEVEEIMGDMVVINTSPVIMGKMAAPVTVGEEPAEAGDDASIEE